MLYSTHGAIYEGAKVNAAELNGWTREYIRAECEKATLILQNRELECLPHRPSTTSTEGNNILPLPQGRKWCNTLLIEKFTHWLDGGEAMETRVEENLQSVALIFAAIKSSRTGMPIKVQELLEDTQRKVIADIGLKK